MPFLLWVESDTAKCGLILFERVLQEKHVQQDGCVPPGLTLCSNDRM